MLDRVPPIIRMLLLLSVLGLAVLLAEAVLGNIKSTIA